MAKKNPRKLQHMPKQLMPEMLAALKQVEPMARTLIDELDKGQAVDWGIVNNCLCAVEKVIAKAEGN